MFSKLNRSHGACSVECHEEKDGIPYDWGCRLYDNRKDAGKSFGFNEPTPKQIKQYEKEEKKKRELLKKYIDVKGFHENRIGVKSKNGKWGFVDWKGKKIVECKYDGFYKFDSYDPDLNFVLEEDKEKS